MKYRMKLALTIVSMGMMAGTAIAASPRLSTDEGIASPSQSRTRGLLDCSAVVELYDGYHDPDAQIESAGDVYDWMGLGPYWPGSELVFHVAFPIGQYGWDWTFEFVIEDGCEATLFEMDGGCGEEYATDLSFSGLSGFGMWPHELWFALDGYDGYYCDVEISFTMTEHVPFSFCADVIDVHGADVLTGDTCDGYDSPVDTCVIIPPTPQQYFTSGLEDYYGVFMPAGSSFTAHLTHTCDASLRVMDTCMEPMNCIGYMDYYYLGFPPAFEEIMPFTNDTGSDALFYLVIDSYDICCGEYELVFESEDGAVADEQMSIGDVKRLYR